MSHFKRAQAKYVKKHYRVRNWAEYEAGLRSRVSLTVWIDVDALTGTIAGWDAPAPGKRKPGRQRKYSNHAIETATRRKNEVRVRRTCSVGSGPRTCPQPL